MNAPITLSERDRMLIALRAFIEQRPGLKFGNYHNVSSYRSEMRSITKDLHDARALLAYVEAHADITADMLREAFRGAYSGRLSWNNSRLDYCTGQYWPTEYRKAACAVLASAIWDYLQAWTDANDAPVAWRVIAWGARGYGNSGYGFPVADEAAGRAELDRLGGSAYGHVAALYGPNKLQIGDYLRHQCRGIFGPSIARRWFN